MARGHEETSTSHAGCKRGTPRETPIVSSIVVAMSVEELRSFSQVPADIKLEVADGTTAPTIRGQIMSFISPMSSLLYKFTSLSHLW